MATPPNGSTLYLSQSVANTPMRDRPTRTIDPSPSMSSTTSLRPSGTPAGAGQPASATAPVTLEGVLSAHSSSPSPPLAALETTISERNLLSSQNAQLWKLIEKQRAGYAQVIKEVERVRAERDAYKGRLHELGEGTEGLVKKERDRDRSRDLKSSASNPGIRATGRESPSNPRAHMVRHKSDDQPVRLSEDSASVRSMPGRHHSEDDGKRRPPSAATSLSQSRLQTSAHHERRGTQSSLSSNLSQHSISASRHRNSPSVHSRLASQDSSRPLYASAHYSSTSSLSSDTNGHTSDANTEGRPGRTSPPPLVIPDRPATQSPLSASTIQPQYSPIRILSPRHTTQPLQIPAKSANGQIPTPVSSTASNGNEALSPSSDFPQPPQSAPDTNSDHSDEFSPSQSSAPASTPRSLQPTVVSAEVPSATFAASHALHSTTGRLPSAADLNVPNARKQMASRESRVELPDEARRYITSMLDSPAPSPIANLGAFASMPPGAPPPQVQVNGITPASPGLDRIHAQPAPGSLAAREHDDLSEEGEFLELDEESTGASGFEDDASSISRATSQDDHVPLSKSGGGGVEDFPMPPSTIGDTGSAALDGRRPSYPSDASLTPPYPSGPTPTSYIQQAASRSTGAQSTASSSGFENDQTTPEGASATRGSSTQLASEGSMTQVANSHPTFRALPLLASDLPHTQIQVLNSSIKPNDRGKEVLSFIVAVEPGQTKPGWKVEKLYSDVLGLDHRVRQTVGKSASKKIASLPEGKLWRDHAPAKVDQRKTALEAYLRSLIALPVKSKDEIIAFLTSDIVRAAAQPVSQVGYKAGYLTKRGKNFGGWKSRYFVLEGPVLEYYESRGGTHLGSIAITGAQIGRQQRSGDKKDADDDNEYRHAFLIIEAKKGPGGSSARHVLCAESDADRDSWVQVLVRYVMGTYNEEPGAVLGPGQVATTAIPASVSAQPRPSTSTSATDETLVAGRRPPRGMSKDDIVLSSAMPLSQLPLESGHAKLLQAAPYPESLMSAAPPPRHESPAGGDRSGADIAAKRSGESPSDAGDDAPLSTSLPTTSPLGGDADVLGKRANSELGYYADMQGARAPQHSPERQRERQAHRKSYHPTLNPVQSSPTHAERPRTPENAGASASAGGGPTPRSEGKVKISGPLSGVPIPPGFKFGAKDPPAPDAAPTASDRREKAKSRSFWGFGGRNAGLGDKAQPMPTVQRAVFGVSIEESLDVAQIAMLPAIVFRCIQYLEAKEADQEEGIYRLSGSSAVIKALKDRFNTEGDVDLLASDEFWDPHAIAGLLKTFLRELPTSILTRDLHLRFLSVIDFVDPEDRIRELSYLIAQLPVTNYSLLRALTAHLISIVQNAHINKMTMRNVGIVFSPTLGIPAGVFSLMLGEFTRVFNVDGEGDEDEDDAADEEATAEEGNEDLLEPRYPDRRNSRQYSDAAADRLLGLSGRTLAEAPEESDESDELSVHDESGTETIETDNATLESSADSATQPTPTATVTAPPAPAPAADGARSKAQSAASTRGLNIAVAADRSRRQSRMPVGLPHSPRPGLGPPSQYPAGRAPSAPTSPVRPTPPPAQL